jgi:crotonobetainyl-CoA:carnitine CoA-transferase CaiB-like acyl-CoA transferase
MLEGIHVLDLSRLLPGGYCTRILADMGAEIIKVEEPSRGDPLRALPGGEVYFRLLHAGKRSIGLRLNTVAGIAALKRLVAGADVLVEGFRPGVMERRGIGFTELALVNPRLVYCAITGYGSIGALQRQAGHDLNYLARSGVLSLMPKASGIPVIPGIQVADLAGGQAAVVAILGAIIERARTGTGQRVEIAMTALMHEWGALPNEVRRAGTAGVELTGEWPCYHVYQVRDGFLTVAALEPPFWVEFCQAIGREDLSSAQRDPAAIAEVESVLKPRTRSEWAAVFADRDVCVEPVFEAGELPQAAAAAAPAVGQHTREVLEAAGFSPAEITAVASPARAGR